MAKRPSWSGREATVASSIPCIILRFGTTWCRRLDRPGPSPASRLAGSGARWPVVGPPGLRPEIPLGGLGDGLRGGIEAAEFVVVRARLEDERDGEHVNLRRGQASAARRAVSRSTPQPPPFSLPPP